MEIRFPATDAPHWLCAIVFSRGGGAINIEVVNRKNQQKALYSIPIDKFTEAMGMLGAVKIIDIGDANAKPLGPREIDRLGF